MQPVNPSVKICGLTRREDVEAAAAAGADALGFVFVPGSPRAVTPARAVALTQGLPRRLMRVGVFQDQPVDFIRAAANASGLDIIQLHGAELPSYVRALGPRRIWKAWAPASEQDLLDAAAWPAEAIVVDSRHDGRFGGTGRPADWDLAARLAGHRTVVLAGGLDADNVTEAIRHVRPAWVDVSSGVETAPGIKSRERIIDFLTAAGGGRGATP